MKTYTLTGLTDQTMLDLSAGLELTIDELKTGMPEDAFEPDEFDPDDELASLDEGIDYGRDEVERIEALAKRLKDIPPDEPLPGILVRVDADGLGDLLREINGDELLGSRKRAFMALVNGLTQPPYGLYEGLTVTKPKKGRSKSSSSRERIGFVPLTGEASEAPFVAPEPDTFFMSREERKAFEAEPKTAFNATDAGLAAIVNRLETQTRLNYRLIGVGYVVGLVVAAVLFTLAIGGRS